MIKRSFASRCFVKLSIPKYFFPQTKDLRRGKFLINRYFFPQIDKALPPRRNLIPAIFSLFLSSFLLFFHLTATKGWVASSEQTFMKTCLTGVASWLLSRAGIFRASRPLRTEGRMRRTSREIFTRAIPAARKFLAPAPPASLASAKTWLRCTCKCTKVKY